MPDIFLSSFDDDRMRTASGNAAASDILLGKTAIVNGTQVTGTAEIKPLGEQNGILLLGKTPSHLNISSYAPYNQHGTVLIKSTAITSFTGHNTWTLSTDGWAYNTVTSYAAFMQGIPPAYTTRRKFEFWGAVQDITLTNAYGVRILFNWVDANNYWQADLRRNTGSGLFYVTIWEVTAGVGTTRAGVNFSSALDMPARWHLTVYEQEDAVIVQCSMNELDNAADVYGVNISYSVASRPSKNSGLFSFGMQGGIVGAEWLINGCRITDLLGTT